MLGARYLDAVARIADSIREDELDGIGELARRVAAAIRDGGLFYVYDNGHMLNAELFNRAGGLALLAPVRVGRPVLGTDAVRPGGEPSA